MEPETKKCPYCGEEILAVAKKCKYCGEWLTEEKAEDNTKQMIPCPICSEMIEEGTEICPHCHEKLTKPCCPAPESPNPKKAERNDDGTRKFFDYYIVEPYLRNYAVFNARLNRKHYFVGLLVWAAIFFGLFLVFAAAMTDDTPAAYQILATGIFGIYTLGSIIPLYATATRRLRDADSAPNTIAWVLLVFASPLILFWICRRTEDEDIRVDGLEPDSPQLVEFGKTDGITCLVLITAIILGLVLNPGAWGNKVPVPANESELISTATMENDTDNDILKIGEALEILNYVEENEEVSNEAKSKINELLIEQYQYERGADEFERQYGDIWVFYKNCVQKGEESLTPIDINTASIVRLGVDAVCSPMVDITVFDKQQLDFLKQQLLKNGFTLTSSEDFGKVYKNESYSAQASWYDEYESGFVVIHKEINTDNDDDDTFSNTSVDSQD